MLLRRMRVDVFLPADVKAAAVRETGPEKLKEGSFHRAPGKDSKERCLVLTHPQSKLGTTYPCLLQCNRDPSQPSYAVELANLAAHA